MSPEFQSITPSSCIEYNSMFMEAFFEYFYLFLILLLLVYSKTLGVPL